MANNHLFMAAVQERWKNELKSLKPLLHFQAIIIALFSATVSWYFLRHLETAKTEGWTVYIIGMIFLLGFFLSTFAIPKASTTADTKKILIAYLKLNAIPIGILLWSLFETFTENKPDHVKSPQDVYLQVLAINYVIFGLYLEMKTVLVLIGLYGNQEDS